MPRQVSILLDLLGSFHYKYIKGDLYFVCNLAWPDLFLAQGVIAV